MKDPVTLSSDITYDHDSIERWIFTGLQQQQCTCPIMRQLLPYFELTPNHTLRLLIQSWCATNSASSVESLPTPKLPVDETQIAQLLAESQRPQSRLGSLHKLHAIAIAAESERSKRIVEGTLGAVDFLASVVARQEDEADGLES